MRQLVWLDLCSGLGGASQPALDRGWKVIRVDIDPRFKPDVVADVRSLPLRPFPVDVLWASPPCIEFARTAMPWLKKRFPNLIPDLSIAQACRDAIEAFKPGDRKHETLIALAAARFLDRTLLHVRGIISRGGCLDYCPKRGEFLKKAFGRLSGGRPREREFPTR